MLKKIARKTSSGFPHTPSHTGLHARVFRCFLCHLQLNSTLLPLSSADSLFSMWNGKPCCIIQGIRKGSLMVNSHNAVALLLICGACWTTDSGRSNLCICCKMLLGRAILSVAWETKPLNCYCLPIFAVWFFLRMEP